MKQNNKASSEKLIHPKAKKAEAPNQLSNQPSNESNKNLSSGKDKVTEIDYQSEVQPLFNLLAQVKQCDRTLLKSRLHGIKKIKQVGRFQKAKASIESLIEHSISDKKLKQANPVTITYPDLPVCEHVDKIAKTIDENQVVIIAGETGSGKTTQIPKICLQLGRGIEGVIGHTQPRRIAARTVATRIAEELETELGDIVGYKVRFNDQVSDATRVKLMTDGILLAEMQKDRLLRQYDTIIIDEAHERSLNIDFILGYIKQILPKRPDLKVIITSATIDPERFSKHFNDAPIIEVSGRTYPVEVRYRPLNEDQPDADYISGIINAVHELTDEGNGDILVFLNGEREIRDATDALEKENFRNTQILPLFSRLSVAEQNRIFARSVGRKVILSTNVAETSLTVPGIRYVIDTGTARISRYSYRTKVQRLPIEPISQASANQRAGRCGRVAAGICIRLYSEEDFLNRDEFTDPEILRTNLATVILQMLSLDLGDIEAFPFVQPPDKRNINDGIRLLEELAAIDTGKSQNDSKRKLTTQGRNLAKFAIDPRLSRMILASFDLGCSEQVLVIVSALSIQDPRERPLEKQQAAAEKHSRFKDKSSDFISFLKLWNYIGTQQKELTNNQFRRLCKKEFLSYIRVREWQDIYSQLRQTVNENKLPLNSVDIESDGSINLIHQAMLTGLLSHLGNLDENREYKGARGSRFYIFPGSGLAKRSPKWLMAAELTETSRLFARTVAQIESDWIEPAAQHLLKRSYSEPHWLKKQGAVFAYEQVSLYGQVIVAKRKVNFNQIEPKTCREIFIREALVNNQIAINEAFLKHNAALIADVEAIEAKARRKDFLVDEQVLFEFYDERLPEQVICQRSLQSWWKKQKQKTPELLNFDPEELLKQDVALSGLDYPDTWQQGNLSLPLSYHFEPGAIDDGVSVHIPIGILNQVEDVHFDWLIPALRLEKITALIRGLPKQTRKNFVPAPNYAQACFTSMVPLELSLTDAMEKHLLRMTGVRIPEDSWQPEQLPVHLLMNFKVFGDKGKLLDQGRDLVQLQERLQGRVKQSIQKIAEKGLERKNITTWDFNKVPESYEKRSSGIKIQAFPALVDHKKDVAIELFEQQTLADQAMLIGLSRLTVLNIPSPVKYLEQKLPNKAKLGLYFNPFGKISDLLDDCILATIQDLLFKQPHLPRTEEAFEQFKELARAEIADQVLDAAVGVEQILSKAHQIRKQLKGNMGFDKIEACADIKEQLDKLVYKGFVCDTTIARLASVNRYLEAIDKRLEKLAIDSHQDKLKMLEVNKAQTAYQELLAKLPKNKPVPAEVSDIRWMIEEFRVSLYAQTLGTAFPISFKRIKQAIEKF